MTAADAESAMPWGANTPSRYSEYMQPMYTPVVAAAVASNAGPASCSASCSDRSKLSDRTGKQLRLDNIVQGRPVQGAAVLPGASHAAVFTPKPCCQAQQWFEV